MVSLGREQREDAISVPSLLNKGTNPTHEGGRSEGKLIRPPSTIAWGSGFQPLNGEEGTSNIPALTLRLDVESLLTYSEFTECYLIGQLLGIFTRPVNLMD